jgi:threonine/homoserine/homoserine lactone efflux protein
MVDQHNLMGFSLVVLGMALTPGPNMMYVVSRSISQGWLSGMISVSGVALGFLCYMLAAAFGITALMFAVPFAYDTLRLVGAAYLLYLAWQAVRPGGASPFTVRDLPIDGPAKLFSMGFLTSILNPKIAMLYMSLLPQFIDAKAGNILSQSLTLGSAQIIISVTVNALVGLGASSIAHFLTTRPTWALIQRWVMGTVLGGFAVKIALEGRR